MKDRSGFGWFELAEGILLILLGGYTFARPDNALTGFIMLYGVVAIIMGVADILLYVRVEHYIGIGPMISLVAGTLSVMSGVMLLVYPGAGKIVMTVLFPLWFIAHCISRLANLNRIRLFAGDFIFYFTLVMNLLGLMLGTLMLSSPVFSWISARYIISIYLVLLGIDCIALAISRMGSRY